MPCIIYVRCCETYMCDCERICSVIPQHICDVIQHICCFTENIPYYCLNIYVHNLTYMTLSPTYTVYIVTYMLIKSSYMMIHEDMDYFIEYNLYAVTYMYQNPTYVVRVFHSSSDSSVDASPTVKQRFTGLSVPGSDNKEMITRFLFLFTPSSGRYSSGNWWKRAEWSKIIFSLATNLLNALVLNLKSFSRNWSQAFCAGIPRIKRDRKTNSCALLNCSTNQKSFLEKSALGNGCLHEL